MRRLINVLVVVLIVVLAGGLALSAVPKVREAAARTQCRNNLRQIGIALESSYDTFGAFPPATVPNNDLSCCQRLSWQVDLVPFLEQMQLVIDRNRGWQDGENLVPKVRGVNADFLDRGPPVPLGEIKTFRCPSNPAVAAPDAPGLTDYVGVAGVGADAAELALGYPGTGVFGCERRTKKEDIRDGLAHSVMVIETSTANGPWTAGGFPTTRGLDRAGGAYLGFAGQFGSGHRSCKGWFSPTRTVVTNVVFADGSVRGLTDTVAPEVLEALATIAGGEDVGSVGE